MSEDKNKVQKGWHEDTPIYGGQEPERHYKEEWKPSYLGAGHHWPFSRITDSGLVGSIFLLCVTAIILFCIFTWFTLPLLLGDW